MADKLARAVDGEFARIFLGVFHQTFGAVERTVFRHNQHRRVSTPVGNRLQIINVVFYFVGKGNGLGNEVRHIVGGQRIAVRLGFLHELIPSFAAPAPGRLITYIGCPR